MKRIIYIVNAILFICSCLMVSTTGPSVKQNVVNKSVSYVNSSAIVKQIDVKEEEIDITLGEEKVLPVEKDEVVDEVILDKEESFEEEVVTNSNEVVMEEVKHEEENKQDTVGVGYKFTGKMSGYGSDIGDYTASGYYIRNSIAYNDNTYGEVRILSGGREFPLGTIIKITNSKVGDFTGIVLDRGPNIGLTKKFAFDLLYKTSSEALKYGVSSNVNFEVLRMGY